MVAANRDVALVIEQSVTDMQSLVRRRGDHFGVERGIAVGEVRVALASGVIAVMDIDATGIAAKATGRDELAVRSCLSKHAAVPFSPPSVRTGSVGRELANGEERFGQRRRS